MKKTFFLLLLLFSSLLLHAKGGYTISVQLKQPTTDQYIYLAKYFAKPMPTIYQIDSAKVQHQSTAVFSSKDSILGGVYLVLFDKKSKFVETILDNGNKYSMLIDTLDLPFSVSYSNSIVNEEYLKMQRSFVILKEEMDVLTLDLKNKKIDTAQFQQKAKIAQENLQKRNRKFAKEQTNKQLQNIVFAMLPPEQPDGQFFLEDGKTVDSAAYFYALKNNYWKDFDFSDNRLINTPILEGKLAAYFNNYVYNYVSDSINYEADILLSKTRNSKELFKYTLHWLTNYTYNSKVMGIDQSFVHLVEKYYIPGDAYWLDSITVAKYADRIKLIAPNALGSKGANIELNDLFTLAPVDLYSFSAPKTLLVFWSIDCGHCLEEIPKLKKVYDESLKAQGVKVFSVVKGKEHGLIQDKVKELDVLEWTNVIDIKGTSDHLDNYDAYATPKIYILDTDKIIRGKGLDHANVGTLIEYLSKDKK